LPILQQFVKNASFFKFASESKIILAGAQVLGEDRLGEHVVNYSSGLGFLDHISLNLGEGELSCELVYGYYSAAPGEEGRVGGGVVAQLDEEQHCEQGEGQNLGDNFAA